MKAGHMIWTQFETDYEILSTSSLVCETKMS